MLRVGCSFAALLASQVGSKGWSTSLSSKELSDLEMRGSHETLSLQTPPELTKS